MANKERMWNRRDFLKAAIGFPLGLNVVAAESRAEKDPILERVAAYLKQERQPVDYEKIIHQNTLALFIPTPLQKIVRGGNLETFQTHPAVENYQHHIIKLLPQLKEQGFHHIGIELEQVQLNEYHRVINTSEFDIKTSAIQLLSNDYFVYNSAPILAAAEELGITVFPTSLGMVRGYNEKGIYPNNIPTEFDGFISTLAAQVPAGARFVYVGNMPEVFSAPRPGYGKPQILSPKPPVSVLRFCVPVPYANEQLEHVPDAMRYANMDTTQPYMASLGAPPKCGEISIEWMIFDPDYPRNTSPGHPQVSPPREDFRLFEDAITSKG